MPANRILTPDQRMSLLNKVKPTGGFEAPPTRAPFSQPAVPWEDRLGDLDEWRDHEGAGRKILPALADRVKTQSACNSILTRLRKLFPDESWSTYVKGNGVYLKYNGKKQRRGRRSEQDQRGDGGSVDELFSHTG